MKNLRANLIQQPKRRETYRTHDPLKSTLLWLSAALLGTLAGHYIGAYYRVL